MNQGDREIRSLVEKRMTARKAGDLDTVLGLMAEEVVFMVPGQTPFVRRIRVWQQGERVEGKSDIERLVVAGNWASMRNRLRVVSRRPMDQSRFVRSTP